RTIRRAAFPSSTRLSDLSTPALEQGRRERAASDLPGDPGFLQDERLEQARLADQLEKDLTGQEAKRLAAVEADDQRAVSGEAVDHGREVAPLIAQPDRAAPRPQSILPGPPQARSTLGGIDREPDIEALQADHQKLA